MSNGEMTFISLLISMFSLFSLMLTFGNETEERVISYAGETW